MADGDGTPPHSKTVKRIWYEQKFKPEYCSKFKFISKSCAGETYATPKTASWLVFCFVSTQCLVYYFLLFLDPNLTIAYLAMLAGLHNFDLYYTVSHSLFKSLQLFSTFVCLFISVIICLTLIHIIIINFF